MTSKLNDSDLEISNTRKVNSGFTRRLTLRLGKITAVYPESNTADVQWIYPSRGGMTNLELTKPYAGFRSGIYFIPEVGSLVTVGFSEDLPILLTYFIPSSFSNMLMGIENKNGDTTRIRKLSPGEISINSVQNCEIYVHDKLEFLDKFGDSIVIDPKDGSVNLDSLQLYINNEAGSLTMGMVKRDEVIITDDGLAVSTINGGNALTEFKVKINKFADNSINSGDIVNEPIAEITVGTLVDDIGKIVYNQKGNKIVCEIKMSSGANIQIDEMGLINMNEGNSIKATDTVTRTLASQKGVIDKFTSADTQQRAAREGDRITIPITAGQTDKDHPNLDSKAVANLVNLSQIAPMFLVSGMPAMFIPSNQNTKLVGEITQGSDSVFIGSLDKTAEKIETFKNI